MCPTLNPHTDLKNTASSSLFQEWSIYKQPDKELWPIFYFGCRKKEFGVRAVLIKSSSQCTVCVVMSCETKLLSCCSKMSLWFVCSLLTWSRCHASWGNWQQIGRGKRRREWYQKEKDAYLPVKTILDINKLCQIHHTTKQSLASSFSAPIWFIADFAYDTANQSNKTWMKYLWAIIIFSR